MAEETVQPTAIDPIIGVTIYLHDERNLTTLDELDIQYDVIPEPEIALAPRDKNYLSTLQNRVKELQDELAAATRNDLTE
jgi:hypothetical protein